MPMRRWVRRPLIQLDARGRVATHGRATPVRGVFHTTEGHDRPGVRDLDGVVVFWRYQRRGYGANILIDKAGNSALGADPGKITWAVRNGNTGSVHVELIGFARFVPKIWWARIKQLNKLAKWMAWLNLAYGIPLEHSISRGWAGHREFPGNDHTDPGRWFPARYVLRKAKQFRVNGWT